VSQFSYALEDNDSDFESNILDLLDIVVARTQDNISYIVTLLRDKKDHMKHVYDENAKPRKFHLGDSVMASNDSLSSLSNALVPHWYGPYRISKSYDNDTYELKDHDLTFPRLYHASYEIYDI
jgi:hypothetical protein